MIGPDRLSDAYRQTDRAEVEAARDTLGAFEQFLMDCAEDCLNGPEQFATHEDYLAARREIWGDDL